MIDGRLILQWAAGAFFAGQLAAPAAGQFLLGGTVLDENTHAAIRHARVVIAQADNEGRNASLFTSEDGRFTFTAVPPGKYRLSAEVHGSRRLLNEDENFSTAIAVGPGLDSTHIEFLFPGLASLRLQVADEEGDPVPHAQIMLFERHVSSGWPSLQQTTTGSTDSEGECHFSHLEPGTYYVAAIGQPWYAQNTVVPPGEVTLSQKETNKQFDVAYPVTYYGGTQDPAAAAALELHAGDKASIQISLRAVPALRIAVTNDGSSPIRAGRHWRGGGFGLDAIGPGGVRMPVPTMSFFDANGEQQVGGIAPGSYFVSTRNAGFREDNATATGGLFQASADTRVNLAELPHSAVTGHLIVEGGGSAPGNLIVILARIGVSEAAVCRASKQETFVCRLQNGAAALTPGSYQVRLTNSSDWFVKSVSAKGAAYANGVLTLSQNSAELTVTVAKGAGKLNGVALHGTQPYAGAMVLLVPRNSSAAGVPRDQSDSDGTFTLPSVHPGSYWLIAIDHGRGLAYHDPAQLAPYLAAAVKLDIPPAGTEPVRVNVQSRRP